MTADIAAIICQYLTHRQRGYVEAHAAAQRDRKAGKWHPMQWWAEPAAEPEPAGEVGP